MKPRLACLLLTLTAPLLSGTDAPVLSRQGHAWQLNPGPVTKTVRFEAGRLTLASFRNQATGRDYVDATQVSPEFRFTADGTVLTGATGGWTLMHDRMQEVRPGQWQLDLRLSRGGLMVEKHYLAYAGTPIIREWLTITNCGTAPVRLTDPGFLAANLLPAEADDLDLSYVTGGGNYNGSQLLKTERMSPTYARVFDSKSHGQTQSYGAYLPLLMERNRRTGDGLMVGWDYLGHWILRVGADPAAGGRGQIALHVAGFDQTLLPGTQIVTPQAFIGAFQGDLDALGNTLLDWQYQHLWDFTNDAYFARTRWVIRWSGAWMGDGGTPSGDNWGKRFTDNLRYVDLMREAGGDVLWDDAGWYDRYGSWRGPDWSLTNAYAAKHGMKWLLWLPTFLASPTSTVGQQHPEWLVPGSLSLEQSIPATAHWQFHLLADCVRRWGPFQWRYDAMPGFSATETGQLQGDANFRRLLANFKTQFPDCGVDACIGGGRWLSYDIARFAESGEYTDGGVGPYSSYYTSLLIPPDKYHNIVDPDHTYYRPASDRIHLCMNAVWYCDPGDGADLDAIRRDWDLYHYLRAQGVVGRWSHVFRPPTENDDPIWYFQRMNRDGTQGVIIARHARTAPTYYVTAQRLSGGERDAFYGLPAVMCTIDTTAAATIETGIYQDPVDAAPRYYGFGNEVFGPVNFRYRTPAGDVSYLTALIRPGAARPKADQFFGLALQPAGAPLEITELGLIGRTRDEWESGANNTGRYRLSLIRAADRAVLASAELDLAQGTPDRLGFKYVKLPATVRLESAAQPVKLFPRGLIADREYDVRCDKSTYRARRLGADLMAHGLEFPSVAPGELIFLNLPQHPGAGTDNTAPAAPARVTKRIGTNLGLQGVEVSWTAATDDHWVSGYEILRDGQPVARSAVATFYFDRTGPAADLLPHRYEVRTVDGDGNRSAATLAEIIAGDSPTFRALGGFSAAQGERQWRYEEVGADGTYRPLRWAQTGFEGQWTGSGQTRIGRLWQQPGASVDVARTFVVPATGTYAISGDIRKDPSANNGRTVQARILRNAQPIWPAEGWAEVGTDPDRGIEAGVAAVTAQAGDVIRFVIRRTGLEQPDPVVWDPVLVQTAATR